MGIRFHKLAHSAGLLVIMTVTAALGCRNGGGGGGGGAAAPSGVVTQGLVKDALVFADHASGTEADDSMDAAESETSAMSDDNGNFAFAAIPAYDYKLISEGGTDSLTGMTAMFMMAPQGARNITPLTTLVALNPDSKAVIEALGVAYDDNLSAGITPAAALLVKSTESIVAATSEALNPGGNSLPIQDVIDIQRTVLAEIANEVAATAAAAPALDGGAQAPAFEASAMMKDSSISTSLTNTTKLTSKLTNAVTSALNKITTKYPNITFPGYTTTQIAQLIVPPIVDTISSAIATSTGSFSFSTTTVVGENTIITSVAVSNIKTTQNGVVGTVSVTVQVISPANAPPVISGTPATTVVAGAKYSFTPTASDADGDTLRFTITNKPSWASFNRGTGKLYGTPSSGNVGTTTGIVISVSDGLVSVSLPPFDLTVTTATGSTGGTGGTAGL